MMNIVLFGPPGAGKGTQAENLIAKYKLIHISTGDVFRKNIKEKTELGVIAKSFMDKGGLVPDEVTINMLEEVVDDNFEGNGFIFDGFPRTVPQAKALDKFLSKKDIEVNAMLALEVEDKVLIKRLLLRGKDSGRADDADESIIKNRIQQYYSKTEILKDFYDSQDKYFGINGEGNVEEISERLYNVIDKL